MNLKHMRILALLLTLGMLLLSLPMGAMAATAPVVTASDAATATGTLLISKAGSTFDAYQLATASVEEGASAYTYAATADFTGFFVDNSGTGGENYALTDGGIGAITGSSTASQQLATDLEAYIATHSLSATPTTILGDATVGTSLDIGYYLIIETDTDDTTATVASKAMLVSIPTADYSGETPVWDFDVVATPKDSEGSIVKEIVEDSSLVDANTAAIGDTISYKITATVPDYDDSVPRANIVYTITDTLSAGLDYADGLTVTYYGTNSTVILTPGDEGYYTVDHDSDNSANADEPITLTFDFEKLEGVVEAQPSVSGKREIVVTFNATLNKNADQTTAGNPNDVELTYTNNPRVADDYYKDDDEVITYTSGIAVKKVDANNDSRDLAGAVFTLTDSENNVIGSYEYDASGTPTVVEGDATTDADGMIYFPGLDEGTYTLTETVAPAGYSLLESPVEITLTALTDGISGELTGAFSCTVDGLEETETVTPTTDTTGTSNKLFFNVTIEDEAGWTLPGTGGNGTRMFTIGGIALIVLSGIVLLIAMKRRSSKTK